MNEIKTSGKALSGSEAVLKVAVLSGGIGTERQVSLESGRCVAEALSRAGIEAILADTRPDDLTILDDKSIDVFFVALHGEFGEDGQLQQILEGKGLCYTGSGPEACKLAIDKLASKDIFRKAGVQVPAAIRFDESSVSVQQLYSLGQRYVVKPVSHGSSVGVSIANNAEEAIGSAKQCFAEYGDCMIEKFIAGREVTVGVLQGKTLPVMEVRHKAVFCDYRAKYVDDTTECLFDTIADAVLVEKVSHDAIMCFESLGCRHFARVDFILGDDGTPYVLEINTIPGMTSHSWVPKAAARIGLSMPDLCMRIVETALTEARTGKSVYSIEAVTRGQKKKEKKAFTQGVT
ncbi:MAG: D-alanine--D-alanine ligase [Phycisphaerales bacterium]|jgi:D-alanine-D-alanine ligase